MMIKSQPKTFSGPPRPLRLAYFVSHPIQYQAPLLRRIASEPDIDLKVFFSSDMSVRGHIDPGFGVNVKWDVPLLAGYRHEFLSGAGNTRGLSSFGSSTRAFTRGYGMSSSMLFGFMATPLPRR